MPQPSSAASRGTTSKLLLLALLLAGCFVLPVLLMRGKSATFDEVAHLPAGYSYLRTQSVKINPQHPPLIKELCALPLLFMDLKMPVDEQALRTGNPSLVYQWRFGKQFLFSQDADRILFWGRVPAVFLSLGLGVLIALWSRRLWGIGGALLSTALYLLDPTITAHAQLVTTDVGLAFFATLFLFVLRGYLASPSRARLALAGVTLGLALGAKFSAILLVPMVPLLLLAGAFPRRQVAPPAKQEAATRGGKRKAGRSQTAGTKGSARIDWPKLVLIPSAVMLVAAFFVVWALYFFAPDPFIYFKGMATVNRDHDPNYFPYLLGETHPGRWNSYLLIAYLVKTPLPELLLLAAAIFLFCARREERASWVDEAFLILPGIGFFLGYSFTADNLGVRYLIPCYPFFMIFAGRLARWTGRARVWAKGALAALLLWMAAEYAAIWPDHLSYFNEITGVPARGDRWLDDSNLDWGQGLMQLRDYLRANPRQDFRLCYFGSGDPAYYGIGGRPISVQGLAAPPERGTYILSAHCVARARAEMSRAYGEGPRNWLATAAPTQVVGHVFQVYEIR